MRVILVFEAGFSLIVLLPRHSGFANANVALRSGTCGRAAKVPAGDTKSTSHDSQEDLHHQRQTDNGQSKLPISGDPGGGNVHRAQGLSLGRC